MWACQDGLYGVQCDQTCSGHCKDNDTCDNYYGTCPTECADGYYDQGCMSLCGNCSNSEVCDTVTGTCPTGCQPGFDPSDPLCKTQTSAESSPSLAGPVAGGVCGGLGVIFLSILVVKLIQRYRKRSSSETASPPQASADQKFESGASNEPNGQAVLEEETGSAVGIQAEESHIYDTTQTPDDSDRAPYTTLFLKGKQDDASNSNTYQNVALHTSPK
ncbi:hypothetical protein V1264_024292 [Littorina saxatilis]|uniref:Uncharacterized protein n=2 Tax=Littorina saxatilis TaxID=31220 RepID=A0AAN9AMJ3_9CAEN